MSGWIGQTLNCVYTVRLSVAKAFVSELPETTDSGKGAMEIGKENVCFGSKYIVDCEDFDRVISSFLF